MKTCFRQGKEIMHVALRLKAMCKQSQQPVLEVERVVLVLKVERVALVLKVERVAWMLKVERVA
jgi:hypothetical protein